jgi:organic radical activating enzyme
MSKLHYTELFYSIQGEGRYMGVPSVFLRMFGCNFRCKNFGRYEKDILGADETHNPEVVEFIKNIDQYKTFKDLPLAKTGCDSYSSIYPEFKQFVIKESSDAIAERIMETLPNNEWGDAHLVITGGEPLLGWQRAYPDLLDHEKMQGLKEITFETNGTQQLTEEFKRYLMRWQTDANALVARDVTFSVSAKLSCSGESRAEAIRPDIVCKYQEVGFTYLKFVIATEDDAYEAIEVSDIYRLAGFQGPIYFMPVGGVESVYTLNNRRVADFAMKAGFRYSDRLQVPLFKNEWGT